MVALLYALACGAHARRSGMVAVEPAPDGGRVELQGFNGGSTRLVLEGEARWLLGCDGCEVTVEGRRAGRKLWVRDFEIRRASDGSQPYVGVLKRYGAQLSIDDRTTGQHVFLDPASVGGLLPYEGHPVLVIGFVVGAQTVRVMAFRVLDEPPPPDTPDVIRPAAPSTR
jgi:hypothetical protein